MARIEAAVPERYVDRIIAVGLALIFLAAWGRGSTSPAPLTAAVVEQAN